MSLIILTVLIAAAVVGCVNVSTHTVVGPGTTEQEGYSKSEDTQSASDVSHEIASRISGIDKSNQEITKNLDKQNKMIKQSRDRDYAVDKTSPDVPKVVRKDLYKRDDRK